MLGDLVVGGLTKLYRRLYDEALVNPSSPVTLSPCAACTVALYRRERHPAPGRGPLQEEIERMRREGVDPRSLCL